MLLTNSVNGYWTLVMVEFPLSMKMIQDIVNFVYPGIECNFKEHQYLRDKAILAPTNKLVDEINAHVLDRIPGEEHVYLSVDNIDEGPMDENDVNSAFPVEFLNSINMHGMPKHELRLKVGVVVMLTRNINQVLGLCNEIFYNLPEL
ncbi:ATP-dependent DNA helicase [Heracleum sosnowskyi]|uniref:ATP-dependent DNA helicase n=1 Tax=Heracleum sosnowskyi TaxID=360622 RepID=A0AAD8LXF6_9APIA|nr:ATP-dependent DNA helicase [Heracleum sosnowskyi]